MSYNTSFQKSVQSGWSCGTCTYYNTNPQFLTCEMCGEAKPETGVEAASAQHQQDIAIDYQSHIEEPFQRMHLQSPPAAAAAYSEPYQNQQSYENELLQQGRIIAARMEQERAQAIREKQQRDEEEHKLIVNARMEEIVRMQQELWAEQQAERNAKEHAERQKNLELERKRAQIRQQEEMLRQQQERLREERLRLELQEQEALMQQQRLRQEQEMASYSQSGVLGISRNNETLRDMKLRQEAQTRPGAVSASPSSSSATAQQSKLDRLQEERENLERRQREIESQTGNSKPMPLSRHVSDELDALEQRQRQLIRSGRKQDSMTSVGGSSTSVDMWKFGELERERRELEERQRQLEQQSSHTTPIRPGAVSAVQAQQAREMEKLNQFQNGHDVGQPSIRPGAVSAVQAQQAREMEKLNQQHRSELTQSQTPASRPGAVSAVVDQQSREMEKMRQESAQGSAQTQTSTRPGAVSAVQSQQSREMEKLSQERNRLQLKDQTVRNQGAVSAVIDQQSREVRKLNEEQDKRTQQISRPGAVASSRAQQERAMQKLQREREALERIQLKDRDNDHSCASDDSGGDVAAFEEAANAMHSITQRAVESSSPVKVTKTGMNLNRPGIQPSLPSIPPLSEPGAVTTQSQASEPAPTRIRPGVVSVTGNSRDKTKRPASQSGESAARAQKEAAKAAAGRSIPSMESEQDAQAAALRRMREMQKRAQGNKIGGSNAFPAPLARPSSGPALTEQQQTDQLQVLRNAQQRTSPVTQQSQNRPSTRGSSVRTSASMMAPQEPAPPRMGRRSSQISRDSRDGSSVDHLSGASTTGSASDASGTNRFGGLGAMNTMLKASARITTKNPGTIETPKTQVGRKKSTREIVAAVADEAVNDMDRMLDTTDELWTKNKRKGGK